MSEPDVVAELRRVLAEWYDTYGEPVPFDADAIQRAIDEIVALRNERNGYGDALQEARDEIAALRDENREMRRTFGSHPLFKEARAEALEEAAQESERSLSTLRDSCDAYCECAAAIRALKDKPNGD